MTAIFRRTASIVTFERERERKLQSAAETFFETSYRKHHLKRTSMVYFLTSRYLSSWWGEVLRDRKDRRDSLDRHGIHRESRRGESHSREQTRRRPPRGLVKVYDQVIEHSCLSGFLGADLSRRNAA